VSASTGMFVSLNGPQIHVAVGTGVAQTRRAMTNEHNEDECRSKIVEHDLLDAHPLAYW
jgi:hypothetical protein